MAGVRLVHSAWESWQACLSLELFCLALHQYKILFPQLCNDGLSSGSTQRWGAYWRRVGH